MSTSFTIRQDFRFHVFDSEKVEFIKKLRRTTYSKKQWLVEAIEEEEIKQRLREEKNSFSDRNFQHNTQPQNS